MILLMLAFLIRSRVIEDTKSRSGESAICSKSDPSAKSQKG